MSWVLGYTLKNYPVKAIEQLPIGRIRESFWIIFSLTLDCSKKLLVLFQEKAMRLQLPSLDDQAAP
ncbi:hypothetical protein A7X86_05120 [Stenotrophomonas maltophilia]|nr:hypothetical protein A7X90_04230 [Stenotrophomonas maltophilia]PZT22173.1 hypothetical protein A7X86_05120 [Stenotrophomonas maltophilia]PZT42896.1 hypothetical protein A7X99_01335 [Stenotrophomonas maltophilia]